MAEEKRPDPGSPAHRLGRGSWLLPGGFFLANALLFAAYRLIFLGSFAVEPRPWLTSRVLLFGLRLDLALLLAEAAVVGAVSLLTGSLRIRTAFALLWFFTYLNAVFAFADLVFYAEGGRHMGPVLLSRIQNPHEIWTEIRNYAVTTPLAPVGLLAVTVAWFYVGRRLGRRLPPARTSLWRPWWRPLLAGLAIFALLLPLREPVTSKRERGWSLDWASSRHYLTLDSFIHHEAIPNPLHEMLVVHLPLLFSKAPPTRLSEEEAVRVCRERFPDIGADSEYPLLRTVSSDLDLGIDSVFLIQVEGLSASLLEHEVDGEPVLPFLRRAAAEGFYFPNTIQSFNNTAGGIFSTVTSLPRTTLGEPKLRLFSANEIGGYFGSLPRILDRPGYGHFFFAGYRQSHFDYTAFMGNQGYEARGYPDFVEYLATLDEAEGSENVLGVYDGVFLRACARKIIAAWSDAPFTAHAMTATTHAPWAVPEDFEAPFADLSFVAFRYLDRSIESCIEKLAESPGIIDRTLVVITGDHTSVTVGDTWLERKRIPLIFCHPRLGQAGLTGRRETFASQVDIVPTVLALMGGRHRYAGLGRNLLDPDIPEGVITGSRYEGHYLKGDRVLEWRLFPEEIRLLPLKDGQLGDRDLSGEEPEVYQTMYREFFGRYDAAQRLSRERRVFPRQACSRDRAR